MIKLLIIADDFTGALDTGVQFAALGAKTCVRTGALPDFDTIAASVLVLDAQTRHLAPAKAYQTVFDIVRQAKAANIGYVYKKTDSGLRGNIGSELAAVLDAAQIDCLPFVAAHPEMGRTTRGGVHYIDGIPVDQSVFGKDPFEPVKTAVIAQIVAEQTEKQVTLCTLPHQLPSKTPQGIWLFDAQTTQDMAAAAALLGEQRLRFCAGCAGFAAVLAKTLGLEGNPSQRPELDAALLVVCGSVNPITQAQIAAAQKAGHRITLSPEQKLDAASAATEPMQQKVRHAAALLVQKQMVLLDANDLPHQGATLALAHSRGLKTEEVRQHIAALLAQLTKQLIDADLPFTLLCTGGDTVLALMQALGVLALTPVCELESGVVLSSFEYHSSTRWVITKSGGFGAPDLLCRLKQSLQKTGGTEMTSFQLKLPSAVFSGSDALAQIAPIITQSNAKRVAVFTDKGVDAAGLLRLPLEWIEKSGASAVVFDTIPPEPSYLEVQGLVESCRKAQCDLIVAVGGGSVMDTAKLASVLMTDTYSVADLLENAALAKKQCKTLMIPTTAGTGAEATPNAIVLVPEKQLKVGIVNDQMIADFVILDAAMIKNLPQKIAAATGVDALAHAIECFTGNKATPFSDLFAMQALELIFANIEKACADPEAMAEKSAMLTASFYAGVAIAASGTTAVHALSYPLGGKYHMPHGISNAVLLAEVMKFNAPFCRSRLALVFDRCFGTGAQTLEEKSDFVVERLAQIVKNLGIEPSLAPFGITEADLEPLVEDALQVTRLLNNNCRPVTAEDAREIYRRIL